MSLTLLLSSVELAASTTKQTESLLLPFPGWHSFSIASCQQPCEKLLRHYRTYSIESQQIKAGVQGDRPPISPHHLDAEGYGSRIVSFCVWLVCWSTQGATLDLGLFCSVFFSPFLYVYSISTALLFD